MELLSAGVHFGHRKSKWYPKMKPYIFSERNGVHIIDLEKTQTKLDEALKYVTELVANKKTIVFVGTKKQAQQMIADAALSCKMPYVNQRWLGGTMTNFAIVMKLIQKYKSLKRKKESGELEKYTKKERLEFDREIARLEKLVGGISVLEKMPDAIFVTDMKKEKTAITEARKRELPIVALCDSNVNPDLATYPIPANDDATKSLHLMINLMAEAVNEGHLEAARREVLSSEKKPAAMPEAKIKASADLA